MKSKFQREANSPPFFYSYLITDPTYYGDDPKLFEEKLTKVLGKNHVDFLCFRDKQTQEIEALAKTCLETAREFNINKVLINGNIGVAKKLGFDGVHLPSIQLKDIQEAKSLGLYTLVSTHEESEIEYCKEKKADGITYSPIFFKENKGEAKGCEKLQEIVQKYQSDSFLIFALGGITDAKRVQQVRDTKCAGFASISYFCNIGFNT